MEDTRIQYMKCTHYCSVLGSWDPPYKISRTPQGERSGISIYQPVDVTDKEEWGSLQGRALCKSEHCSFIGFLHFFP